MARGYRKQLGDWGEQAACDYLEKQGCQILERNYRVRQGEADIIAQKDGRLLFVEVKTRASQAYGYGEDAITPKKLQALLQSADAYLEHLPEPLPAWQIDLIVVEGRLGQPGPNLLHYENLGEFPS
ncbi:MAG TPA: YraN family protein [Anaerolineaceae bacterium]|jgi:putative endonuclease|nr:YraN family protein [Anaerolineaceae bacterium]